jgi:16S rRNA G966 N2-methylase RsmD
MLFRQCVDIIETDLVAALQSRFDVILVDPPWEEYRLVVLVVVLIFIDYSNV